MRFTGQVKIPDLDYPGVPASLLVEGKQLELFVEDESIGRWSLVDVRAERLISSAFSLKLADEEVTFIADQPTEFAYGGVEEMANVWARHRTMRFPRRIVANSRSRQGTKPSRIGDLRDAIEESLNGIPTALVSGGEPARKTAAGVESLRRSQTQEPPAEKARVEDKPPARPPGAAAEPLPEPEPALVEDAVPPTPEPEAPAELVAADPVPAALDTPEVVLAEPAPEPEPVLVEDPVPPTPEPEAPAELVAADPVPEALDTPEVVLAEPAPEPATTPPVTDSVFKESVPWAKREEDEVDDEPDQVLPAEPTPEVVEDVPAPIGVDSAPEKRTPEPMPQSPLPSPPPGSVPWIDPMALGPTSRMPGPDEEEAEASQAESITKRPARRPPYVVDLGAFEDPGEEEPIHPTPDADRSEPVPAEEESQPELATASARGGIVGAVRSAFVRNRVEHTHEFVEAPGGLGIKRHICAECGHISIGLSE